MDDTLLLSRLQFALNISFHILFPVITIALGWMLVFFKYRFWRTGEEKWMESYFLWTKIFALSFALGVVSGITMPFQFGTNWPGFMETVGNIAGPLLAYEVLTAFFLEATFLSIMLFGYKRVPDWLHTLATWLVSLGTTLSAFVILVLSSWMVTPAGFEMREGLAHATSWWEIIFNPSMPYRFAHMMLTSGLTVAFLLAGLSAYRWLRHDKSPAVMSTLKTGVYMALGCIILQFYVGDLHGVNTAKHQPATFAAIEALWKTEKGAPLLLVGLPDAETKTNNYVISLPKMTSWLAKRNGEAEVVGLDQFPEHAPVLPVFIAFRVMVGLGILMFGVALWASFVLWRKKSPSPLLAKVLVGMSFAGWLGTLAGWCVTEVGRQPYLVQGVLKTADAVTHLPPQKVGATFVAYAVVYVFLLPMYVLALFYLARQAARKEEPLHKIEVE